LLQCCNKLRSLRCSKLRRSSEAAALTLQQATELGACCNAAASCGAWGLLQHSEQALEKLRSSGACVAASCGAWGLLQRCSKLRSLRCSKLQNLELAAIEQASSGEAPKLRSLHCSKFRSLELAALQQVPEPRACCIAASKLRRSSEAPKLALQQAPELVLQQNAYVGKRNEHCDF
jgi:hypothetical protein